MKIAVIPARGGSKRIPRKNIKDFCGKPMIAWSISAALESNLFDAVIVSTDDTEIAVLAESWGAKVPFVRPESLSGDVVGTTPVIAHAVQWHTTRGMAIELACCIYATAPFVTPLDLQSGLKILVESQADFAFSVASYPFPIQRALRLIEGNRVQMFHPEHFQTRSQDLEPAYHDAGQFYWGRADAWLANKPLFSEHAAPIVLPRYRVQDIDTPEDWDRAEWLFRAMHSK